MSGTVRQENTPQSHLTSFIHLSRAHLVLALSILIFSGYRFTATGKQLLLLTTAGIVLFIGAQVLGLYLAKSGYRLLVAVRTVVGGITPCMLVTPLVFDTIFPACLFFLVAVPIFYTTTGQLKKLPNAFLFTFLILAITILIDLVSPWQELRLPTNQSRLWYLAVVFTLAYLAYAAILTLVIGKKAEASRRFHLNLATLYSLVITLVSATVIILVAVVLIRQIRSAQVQQVGQTFQTIAENFGEQVGSHLEQQMQKLQLLVEQVPAIRESFITANRQYGADRNQVRELLEEKNRKWLTPEMHQQFVMTHLNNNAVQALSRFRGHNSFHHDILLVDKHGGLIGSLGRTPSSFTFYDQKWWKVTSNRGLGNVFFGDLATDEQTGLPSIRISIAVVDHTSNRIMGMLSSFYYLRTLIEDLDRFKPESVDQVSLIDANNRIIASTLPEQTDVQWPHLNRETKLSKSGWTRGEDYQGRDALIGYSSLTIAYNVISDPLEDLGWRIVVSGTRKNAMASVHRSTKWAMLAALVAMALSVFGAITAAYFISKPLEELTAITSAMSEGNLETRARTRGPEELVALSQAFNQLTQRLHEVITNMQANSDQLGKAKQEAENATRLKDEFLAKMSHEIRTPLNAILGFANLLEEEISESRAKRHAQIIRKSGSDLLLLINDILDLSKIEAGHMVLQPEAVSLRDLYQELQGVFSVTVEEKDLRLMTSVESSVPELLTLDRVRLRQILFNLIGNALKFTSRGEVRCIARSLPSEKKDRIHLILEVSDTGRGIAPEDLDIIFEKFKQDQNTTLSAPEGSGLGLTISKNLVEMMGGTITVISTQGIGTTFTISINDVLPADIKTGELLKTSVDSAVNRPYSFQPSEILVVDDLDINCRLITELLGPYNFSVDQADSGIAALEQTGRKKYDLILLDIRMPRMDGFEVLRKLRRDRLNSETQVVATTASAMKAEITAIQDAGFDHLLIRPFGLDQLLHVLAAALPHKLLPVVDNTASEGKKTSKPHFHDIIWSCPEEVVDRFETRLKPQWHLIQQQQSIPDIIKFADDVHNTGEKYGVEILQLYGNKLREYAEDFDISNVDQLISEFGDMLQNRTTRK